MKENDVREILLKNEITFVTHGTICASVVASVGAYQNGMGNMMHTMKDHILHINKDGVAIIALDDINGTMKEDSLLFISRKEIITSNIKAKMTKFIFSMTTAKGEIQYKIRKNVLACPWHKENFSYLLIGSGV